jgi:hypothetical protein
VNAWNLDGGIQRSLLAPDGDRSVIPVTERMIGLVTKTPVLNGREWLVPALVYGRAEHRRVFRAIDFTVSTQHGALRVMPTAASPTHPLRTVADAVAFAASALDRDVPPPPLPSNTAFLPNSFQAWTSRGRSMVGFEVRLPGGSRGPGGPARMGFAYGAVSFMQGCGDSGAATKEIRLGTAPALLDSTDDMYQVIWPATIGDDRSIYSVSGFYVSQETVLASARDMEAATR